MGGGRRSRSPLNARFNLGVSLALSGVAFLRVILRFFLVGCFLRQDTGLHGNSGSCLELQGSVVRDKKKKGFCAKSYGVSCDDVPIKDTRLVNSTYFARGLRRNVAQVDIVLSHVVKTMALHAHGGVCSLFSNLNSSICCSCGGTHRFIFQ